MGAVGGVVGQLEWHSVGRGDYHSPAGIEPDQPGDYGQKRQEELAGDG